VRPIELTGNLICAAGGTLWIYGYFVNGHASIFDWPAFSPPWISAFLPNLESEVGLIASFVGMALMWIPRLVGR
jgi:hypothetical protein